MRERLGVCQWFHFEAEDDLEQSVALLEDLGVKHLRTGVSWADFHRAGGKSWYDHQMVRLKEAGLEVLLSVWHTPPSLAEGGSCAGPPRDLKAYADFIDQLIDLYGDCFETLELWNEPNNLYKWDFESYDPDWSKFAEMICGAGYWARERGRTTVLGGAAPADPHWLQLMADYGVLDCVDIVAIHAFPGMWWPDGQNWEWYSHWAGWERRLADVRAAIGERPLWVTETGLATCDRVEADPLKYGLQEQKLVEAAEAPVERLYWYSLVDLHPERDALEGFHVDENEYHMGLVTYRGRKKPAYQRMKRLLAGGVRPDAVRGDRRAVGNHGRR